MNRVLNYLIAAVWLINGLFCKVLDLVPRHQQIVARILRDTHAMFFTIIIGIAEIMMAMWIVSRIATRLNAVTQILIIAAMNSIEFLLAPDLLFWGKLNALFATIFILIIYCNEFILNKKFSKQKI
jgi:hypothetical protein